MRGGAVVEVVFKKRRMKLELELWRSMNTINGGHFVVYEMFSPVFFGGLWRFELQVPLSSCK